MFISSRSNRSNRWNVAGKKSGRKNSFVRVDECYFIVVYFFRSDDDDNCCVRIGKSPSSLCTLKCCLKKSKQTPLIIIYYCRQRIRLKVKKQNDWMIIDCKNNFALKSNGYYYAGSEKWIYAKCSHRFLAFICDNMLTITQLHSLYWLF